MKKIQAIIFDMGDILFDATQWRTKLYAFLIKLGYKGSFDDMIKRWDKCLKKAHLGEVEYQTAFKEFIFSLGYNNEYKQIQEFSLAIAEEVKKNRRLFPGVKKTLQQLKQRGLKLAILTDSESCKEINRNRLRKLSINTYFDVVVSSADIGYVKPQREAFQITLNCLEIKNNEAIFVGHDYDELEGAKNAGLKTIAFNYNSDVPADYYVTKFGEILSKV